ncbi:hypothetical protein [Daejeonella sp. H1SJ63]|uniref:beta strand repeat-containing protein n=1 Tax=Daejeonella sp. H1SJ63 TaxID=3034145 RepID=UPI0023EC7001|nr:hypothetical protein [Daejeonella sp. H1SJ63]
MFVLIVLLAISYTGYGATYYSRVATGNFATAGSWSTSPTGTPTNLIPILATDIFIIQNGHNITLAAAQTVAGITVDAGGTLTATTFTLTVNGNWAHNGSFIRGTGTVLFSAVASAISGGATLALNNLTISAATTLTLNNNVTVAGNVTMNVPTGTTAGITISGTNSLDVSGTMNLPVPTTNGRDITVDVGAGTLTVGGLFTMSATTSGTRLNFFNISTGTANLNGGITTGTSACRIVFSGSGTLNIAGTVSTGPPAITESTGTINFTGASQNIWLETYYNLGISGTGTKALNGNITVNNVLNVASSILDLGTRTLTLSGTGTPLLVGGTLTPGTSTVIFSGAGAQTVAGTTYNNLTFSGAGTKTIADASTPTIAGAWVVGSPLDMAGTGSATVTGALSGAGAITMGSGTLTLGTTFTHTGTFSAGTGKVLYNGAAGQSVRNVTYYDLEFSGSGTKTIAAFTTQVGRDLIAGSTISMTTTGGANIAGNISGSGNITMSSGTITLGGSWTNNGTLTAGTGTIHYDGSGDQTIAVLPYYKLQTSVGGIKTLNGNITVTNVLTVTSPSTLNLGVNTVFLSFTGAPLVNTGTISGTGVVNYSGGGAQTVAGTTYPNLEFSGAGTKTIAAGTTVTVTNNWVAGSPTAMTTTAAAIVGADLSGTGAITMGSGTINIAGSWTHSGTFTRGTGTVIYDGINQTIAGLIYYNLQTSNSGVKTLAVNTTVANILTISASTTLDLSTVTLTLSGAGTPLVNNGTFTSSTSTVSFSNVASANIPALNYYNLTLTGGPRVLANTGTIGIANTFTPGAGGFTVTGSIVNFNGSGVQIIPAFTFNDVVLSGSGAKTIASATVVSVRIIEIQDGPTLDIAGTGVLNVTN